jgi:hypothetical protein
MLTLRLSRIVDQWEPLVSGNRGAIYDAQYYVGKLKSKYSATVSAMDKYVPGIMVGRCRLTVSNPVLKAPVIPSLETRIA